MAKKISKNIVIGCIVAAVVVIAIIVGVIVATKGKGNDGGSGGQEINQVDYSIIDVSIDYGDYDAMYTEAKAIQNGESTGKIIKIDGVVSHPLSKYSIVEESEGGNKIGTEFEIEGASEDDYPKDGQRVVITGEVIEKQPLYFIIKTAPKYVEIVEE